MSLKSSLFIVAILVAPTALGVHNLKSTNRESCPNLKTSLSSVRKRRHLAFPTGSVVSLVLSGVKTLMTHVPSGWYVVVEGELLFKLPDAAFVAAHKRRKLYHRQKKEAWDLLQSVFDKHNMNGQACILRTICEAQTHLAPKGKSLVHDLLRSMFTAHLQEENFIKEIGETHDQLLEPDFCEKPNDCPFSFLNFIFEFNKQR